jgi:hypothetical protein
MFFIPAILFALAGPTLTGAPDAGLPSPSRWQVSASVASGTPAALPGLTIGGDAEVARRLFSGPLFVSGHVSLVSASAASPSWTIEHRQLVLAAALGLRARSGVGQLWVEAGGGALGLREVLGRHQLERIQMSDIPGGTQTSFAVGPYAFGEVGVGVCVRGSVSARLSAGPVVSRISLAEGPAWRFGALAKIGAAYDF